jgi:beta-1,4-mannosyltransferase
MISLFGLTYYMALFSSQWPKIFSALDLLQNAAKISWLLPIPYFILQTIGFQRGVNQQLILDLEEIKNRRNELPGKRIIYTITTKGENLKTLTETVKSSIYWTQAVRKKHDLPLESEVWLLTEEESLQANPQYYKVLENQGAHIIAVPSNYQTRNGSVFKTRALQYAAELRHTYGLDGPNDWIYHQDTETKIGEDTVLGNIDFILNADSTTKAGSGIILYSQGWDLGFTNIQETARSSADLCAIGQMNSWGKVIFGYHGSHILINSEAEGSLGWDYGQVRSEDLLFSVKLRSKHGACVRAMKGFAYEKSPQSLKDHLKQRRRWVLGTFEILKRKDVTLKSKGTITYSILSWFSALPSLAITFYNLLYPSEGFIPILGGVFSGLVWWSMLNGYLVGLDLHRIYVKTGDGILNRIKGVLVGLAADAIAPWYAIIFRTKGYDEIKKDESTHVDGVDTFLS